VAIVRVIIYLRNQDTGGDNGLEFGRFIRIDMLTFDAARFVNITRVLEQLKHEIGRLGNPQIDEADPATIARLIGNFGHLRKECSEVGLDSCTDQVDRVIQALERGCSTERYLELVGAFQDRLHDELDRRQCYIVPPSKAKFINGLQFSDDVRNCFRGAILDMDEAGTCYAMGRNNACVMHLQRVMESGLKRLGEKLEIDINSNRSWDSILQKADPELSKRYTDKSEFFKANEQWCAEAVALLRAVKIAWRNPTMHVENIYDEAKGLEVYNSVVAFMRHLSGKLCQ
jgi:hypothetical protein